MRLAFLRGSSAGVAAALEESEPLQPAVALGQRQQPPSRAPGAWPAAAGIGRQPSGASAAAAATAGGAAWSAVAVGGAAAAPGLPPGVETVGGLQDCDGLVTCELCSWLGAPEETFAHFKVLLKLCSPNFACLSCPRTWARTFMHEGMLLAVALGCHGPSLGNICIHSWLPISNTHSWLPCFPS